jgi:mono/diheme cytochrome c family protein
MKTMRYSFFPALLIVAMTLSVSGCRSARRGEPMTRPLRVSDPAVAQGQRVFHEHCHQCHPGGEGGLGPALNNKPLPGFLIKYQVRRGLGVMPNFDEERVTEEELDYLMQYLAALRKSK